jgi:hypothetical protein
MQAPWDDKKVAYLSERFSTLDEKSHVLMLTILLRQLTIIARDTYEPNTDAVRYPASLREYNEIQHQVASQILNIMLKHEHVYDGRTFVEMLLHRAQFTHNPRDILSVLSTSIEKALEYQKR